MTHILELSSEVLIEIFLYFDIVDLLRFKATCHTLYEVIDDSAELVYKIELEKTGVENNPHCSDAISDRLRYLKARDDAWGFFNVRAGNRITMPPDASGLYDLSLTEFFLGMASDDGDSKGLYHIRLPSMFSDDAPKRVGEPVDWKFMDLGMNIIEFGLAIEEHDLVACAVSEPDESDSETSNVVVVLLRHSTKEEHDESEMPIIHLCRAHESQGKPSISIAICGESLAIVVVFRDSASQSPHSDFLFVFDWKTGERKTVPFPVYDAGLIFLREDILVNPNALRRSLDIYHIPSSESMASNPPNIFPFPTRVRLIHSLLLPSLLPQHYITSFLCRSSPNPTADDKIPKYTLKTKPYLDDPARAIILFTLTIQNNVQQVKKFHMIIHRQALLDLVPWEVLETDPIAEAHAGDIAARVTQMSLDTSSDSSGAYFPDEAIPPPSIRFKSVPTQEWESWGPPITRWFDADEFSSLFITATAGQRYVQFTPSPAPDVHDDDNETASRAADTIHLLDFNPWTVRRAYNALGNTAPVRGEFCSIYVIGMASHAESSDEGEEAEEAEENICPGGGAFGEDIVGRLPFVRCTSSKKWAYDGVLIHEEMLLGMHINREMMRMGSMQVMYFG